MAETENPDNSDDSDATDSEMSPEEGEGSEETPDDNETPVTDPSEEAPEVTDPAETETPVEEETPSQEEEEGEASEAPDATVMEDGAEEAVSYKVTYKIMNGESEAAEAAAVNFTAGVDNNNIVIANTDITFTVTPAAEYELAAEKPVKVTVGETDLADGNLTESEGTYAIKSGAVNGDVAITISVVDKTYTVSAPKGENSVSWKIKESTATEYGSETSVKIKKGASVKLEATLADNADPVDVTVGTETKSLTATEKTAEFTVALADLTAGADGSYSITAAYVVKKAEAEVTVAGKDDAVFGTDFTATYSVQNEDGKFGTFQAVPADGKIAAHDGDVIGFHFTALEKDGKARKVSKVTFGAADSTTEADTETDKTTGEITYSVKVAKPATPENNIVTVALEETNVITIKKAADAKIEKMEYSTDSSNYQVAVATADGWKVETKESSVTFKVTAVKHNKVSYIHKGTEAHAAECTNDMTITPATVVTTTDSIDASSKGETLTIATEQITIDYKFVTPEKVTATIQKKDGTAVAPKGTEGNDAKTYVLNDGESYFVKVADVALEKIDSVTIGSSTTSLPYSSSAEAFPFTASETDADPTITVKVIEAKGYSVSVVMDEKSDGDDFLATIQADAYVKDAEGTEQGADASAKEIKAGDDGSALTYESVWEDTDFSFALAAKDSDNFKVTKVQTSTDEETWKDLAPVEGKYTLEAINADTTIKVTTDYDTEKAYSISFMDVGGNIASVKADFAGGTDAPKNAVELGKANYLKSADGAKVRFTVETKDGYSVDKVSFGAGADDVLTAADNVYTYDKFSADAKAATITISTKANALDADKYVKISTDENVTLEVTEPANMAANEDGVYVLTKEVKEGETVKTAEISELKFNLVVPYGYTLSQEFVDTFNKSLDTAREGKTALRPLSEKRVKSEDGSSWIYSYKVVANQLTGTKEAPNEIETGAATKEEVSLKLADDSETVEWKNASEQDSKFSQLQTNSTERVPAGSTVLLKVAPGQTLKVGGEDVTKELDSMNKYSFVAALDDTVDGESTVEIDVKNQAGYTISYIVDPDEDSTEYTPVGEDAVEAKIGSKVAVKLTDADQNDAEITRYELSEGAKSVYKADDTNTNQGELTVADSEVSVTLYTEVEEEKNNFVIKTEVLAGTITVKAKDAAGKTLTAKGLKNKGTVKLDATSVTSYALTLKDGRTTLNAGEYASALSVKVTAADGGAVSDAVKAVVDEDDGNLYVTVMKAEKAVVTISAASAADTPLLTFTVDGQKPALKVKKVSSNNQGMNDILVDVTPDTAIKSVADDFDLYYEVNVAQKEGSTSTTNKDGVYYLPAKNYDAKGKFAPISQLFKVNADAPDKAAQNTYTFTVRMVAVEKGTDVKTGEPAKGNTGTALADANVKFASEKNVTAEFKTRPAYYEDKLNVTKKTIKFYSGQSDVVVAVPKFSKNASYIDDISAVVYNKDGSLAYTERNGKKFGVWVSGIDEETMEVKVSSSAYAAGTYDVVIYATAANVKDGDSTSYTMYQASAKVPVTVQKSINWIDVDYPAQIAMVADKKGNRKDVSITLKPVGAYDTTWIESTDPHKTVKAQTQKFTYELLETSNPKNRDKIVLKNNKITVKKDFVLGKDLEDNQFAVKISAADHSENSTSEVAVITVNGEALEIASVKLMDQDGKALPQTITTLDLVGAYVSLTDKNGQEIDPSLVTLTPNKGKLSISSETGIVEIAGYQKNLTVKAVSKDGGKKSCSSMKYTINYPDGVTYDIGELSLSSDKNAFHQIGDRDYTYMGKGNEVIYFEVMAKIGDEANVAHTSQYNYSVKVDGGKVTSTKYVLSFGGYEITPNKDTVKVTITDKTKKGDKGITFTFKDNNWQTAAAPKASTKDKLYATKAGVLTNDTDFEECADIAQSLTYTVTKNNGYDAVKLTWLSGSEIMKKDSQSGRDDDYSGAIETITKENTFTLSDIYADKAGTAKYSAVYGNMVGGVFYPKTKAAALSIKVNKTGNVKAVTSYTINPNVAMGVKLEAKNAPVNGMVQFNKVVSANVSGKANQFYDYFEVVAGRLQIKKDKQTPDGLAALAALDKKDLTGYLEYQFSNAGGDLIVKQDKITVKISDKALPKYVASAISIAGTDKAVAKTTITLGGEAVNIAQAAEGEGNTADWKATVAADEKEKGIVTLTAAATPKAGKVDLYVIPADSKNTAVTSAEDIRKFGVKVQVTVTVKDAADAKSKLSFAKGSATPVASINASSTPNKVDLTVTLTEGKDFTYTLSNEAVTAAAKTDAAAITNANDKKVAEAVNSVSFTAGTDERKDTLVIVLDRDKLDGNKVYKVPADLTFTSGTKATVTFSVKTEKIPTSSDVAKLVGDALAGCPVKEYNDGAKAAAEVLEAAKKIDIPALSGFQVTKAEEVKVEGTDFGDKTVDGKNVEGHHKVWVTLTDVTKDADAEGATVGIEFRVSKMTAEQTPADALAARIKSYRVPDADGKVPEGKTAVPTTKYALQAALQAALDAVAPNKYIVKVTSFEVKTADAGTGASVMADGDDAITEISYAYEVKDAMTGKKVEDMGSKSTVTVSKDATCDVPVTSEPEPPAEVTVQSVTVSAAGGATTVKAGETLTFTAKVTGSDNNEITSIDASKVTWTVESASDNENTREGEETAKTEIAKDSSNPLQATLKVSNTEAANTTLKVKATVDGKASNEVSVTVTADDSGNSENTEQ